MKKENEPGPARQERYIQPSILMGLLVKPYYGYELIGHLQNFGFLDGPAPPGMVYRHLRQLETDGMVISQWETKEAGAAKRMYQITDEGKDVLAAWIDFMRDKAEKLQNFIGSYEKISKGAAELPSPCGDDES